MITPELLQIEISKEFNLSWIKISKAKNKNWDCSLARQTYAFILSMHGFKDAEIGLTINRPRQTVVYYKKQIGNLLRWKHEKVTEVVKKFI